MKTNNLDRKCYSQEITGLIFKSHPGTMGQQWGGLKLHDQAESWASCWCIYVTLHVELFGDNSQSPALMRLWMFHHSSWGSPRHASLLTHTQSVALEGDCRLKMIGQMIRCRACYLFIGCAGSFCCALPFSNCAEWGLIVLSWGAWLLTVVAPLMLGNI